MFLTTQMRKVRLLCQKNKAREVVAALYDFGAVEVRESKALAASNKPLGEFKEISARLVELRALERRFQEFEGFFEQASVSGETSELLTKCRQVPLEQFNMSEHELKESQERLSVLREKKIELMPFRNLGVGASLLKSPRLKFHYFSLKTSFEELSKSLKKIVGNALLVEDEGKPFVLLALDNGVSQDDAEKILLKHAKEVFILPEVSGESFRKEFLHVLSQENKEQEKLADLSERLLDFKQSYGGLVSGLVNALEARARESELPAKFGSSDLFLNVEAWLPAKLLHSFEKKLRERLGESFFVEEISSRETPPVLLDNPAPVKPFEFLVKFFSLPGKGEFDPTILISLSFPVFFGLILGDVGYGLVSLLLALFLRAKFKQGFFRSVSGMMLLSALSTIFFGFVYAEFFGFSDLFGYNMPVFIHRASEEGLRVLMALCILLGFIHLAIGFAVGAIAQVVGRHWKHAFAKVGWIGLETGFFSAIALVVESDFFEFLLPLANALGLNAALGLTVTSLIILIATEGPVGLLELPGLIANLFSYLRIMALGVSGVILALIIDSVPLNAPSLEDFSSILMFLFMASIFIVGHAVAIGLGLFEASIQSLRLHYVEFFSKFYKGGGIGFAPLRENALNEC